MSGEYTFGASDDIVRRIRENLPHIEWEQPLSAERERLAADEIVRLRKRLQACQSNDDYPLTDDCITQNERFLLAEVERLRAAGDALAEAFWLRRPLTNRSLRAIDAWDEASRG